MHPPNARGLALAGALLLLTVSAPAREIEIPFSGLTLPGNLVLAEGKGPADGVVLITHGTLAHGRMEIIQSLQDLLQARGLNSLAITLSLGIDRRQGMYDCSAPHRHTQVEAIAELGAWVEWLRREGATRVVLLGHSRGGNQVAWYAAEHPDPVLAGLVLVAPNRTEPDFTAASYAKAFQTELAPVLEKARAMVEKGQGGELLSPVGFLYCPDASASAEALLSYYEVNPRMDTPTVVQTLELPTLVVGGSADQQAPGLDQAFTPAAEAGKVRLVVIDGADHFFRDLYGEDAADAIAEFVASP
jgi:pimeloyl-ACP methyl ester carboxylesterase